MYMYIYMCKTCTYIQCMYMYMYVHCVIMQYTLQCYIAKLHTDLLAVDELVVKEEEMPLLRVSFGDLVQFAAVDHLSAGLHYVWALWRVRG